MKSQLLLVLFAGLFCQLCLADESQKVSAKKCDQCLAASKVESFDKYLASGECAEGKCPSGSACCATLAAAKEKLPKLTYKVGEESTCCAESAMELSKKANQPVKYVVAGKAYDQKQAAMAALVEETETFVNMFVTPSRCEASGTTTVAGKAYGCCNAASKQAGLVSTAVAKVRMAYKVGDEEVCCAKHAATLAKQQNAPILYVVDGDATECELTARLKIATAKYLAAISAVASAVESDTNKSDS